MFSQKQFNNLHQFQNTTSPCVSIYIPTYKAGNTQEDKLRFKNALSEATYQLTDNSLFPKNAMTKNEALKLLAPAFELQDNDDFWTQLSEGLAVFIGENHFSYFICPIDFPKLTYVHNHFYLRHMLPLLKDEKRFFVLALSQNDVRFFEGNANNITPVIIEDLIPMGTEEMIGMEDNTPNIYARSSGSQGAIFHGHGGGKDNKNETLKKYFKDIDDGLMKMLHDENPPMVIYSVDNQIPIYQEISKYSNLHHQHIVGNPDNDDPVLIHEKAWSILEDHFNEKYQLEKENFNQNLVDGKASFSIHDIAPAAISGKVEILFLDTQEEVIWGDYDEKNFSINLHESRQPNSICLLNKMGVETFNNSGTVYNRPRMEMPRVITHVNAVFRY
ncbi:MAG: hypothetical protein AB8H03_14375 [Saprospiraceae bacterium]